MAITATHLTFTRDDGGPLPSGSLGALFPAARVGAATDYAAVIVTNTHPSLTLSAVKFWLTRSSGAALAIAVANGPVAGGVDFTPPALSSLTYSTASSKSAALSLSAPGTLAPGQRVLLAIRRTLTGATAADPQTARLYIGGNSPL